MITKEQAYTQSEFKANAFIEHNACSEGVV